MRIHGRHLLAARPAVADPATPPALPSMLALLLLLPACSPALNWRDVRPVGTALQLQMPCRPNLQARTVSLGGQPVRLQLLVCDADGRTWALATASVAESGAVDAALQALRAAALANIGADASVAISRPLQVPGATPQVAAAHLDARGRLPDGQSVQIQAAVFADGSQVHQATALGPALPAAETRIFFDSLRIVR
ncbi:MAG: hypothetical protein ABIN96_04240 [Rubrivivax sp.]